jgi:superfamily II DNA or RNA helicase
MLFEAKDYQVEAFTTLRQTIGKGIRRVVLKAPTGVGKTYIAAMIAESALMKGKRVTFVAPYTTLINQTVARFMEQELPLPGVIQGQHELTDAARPLQIATAQTLGRRSRPICDIVIVDEAHLMYKSILEWMEDEPDKIFIGLTATPFAKGMGKFYQDLIKIKTLGLCLDDGTLSPYEVYGVETPDLSGVGMQSGDYKQKELGDVMGDAKLVGNIVTNWLENGENGQTIVFAVNVLHANKVANDFEAAGVKTEVVIAKTENRDDIFERFEKRQTRVLISVGCLIAGFDSYVDCIIWAAPTKSAIKFIQGIGRGLRNGEGKKHCTIFDHSGTFTTMGYIEDVDDMYSELCSGEKTEVEAAKVEREEKKEKVPKQCPKKECGFIKPAGIHECPKCGFTPRFGEDVEVDESRGLKKLKKGEKKYTKEQKELFFRMLKGWQKQKKLDGKLYSDGYVAHVYKGKFEVWPRGLSEAPLQPSADVLNYIKSRQIAYAKSKGKK